MLMAMVEGPINALKEVLGGKAKEWVITPLVTTCNEDFKVLGERSCKGSFRCASWWR